MRNYIMTTALFVSAIAVNGAFAEDTPVLKVDTTSQEKIEAANEESSASADVKTKSVKDVDNKTQTKDDVAQKKQYDDVVTNSIKTDDEAEKTEPQGVLNKIMAYFSGE